MAIRARDQTGDSFDRVTSKIDRLQSMAVRSMTKIGSLAMGFATLGRVTGLLNEEQARAIGLFGTVMHVLSTGYYVAKTIATGATWAHNTALTWEVSLMTLGVGAAIAAAAAIALLSMQTQKAADSQKNYNEQLEYGLTIERRRQASQRLVRRGEFEEVIE
jgi:hypothetical protein